MVLPNKFFVDKIFWKSIAINCVQVKQGHTELISRNFCNLSTLCQAILHQVIHKRYFLTLRLGKRLQRFLVSKQFGNDELLGQAG